MYLDYAKAFGKVPYAVLLKKLHTFGMNLNFISLMRSYLLDGTQKVLAHGQFSNAPPVISGVPQASVLGTLVFSLFINDLPATFLDAKPWLFTDDSNLFFKTADFRDDLVRLHNWNLSNGNLANTAKRKFLNIKSVTDVNLSGINLMKVYSQRDLGVVVTSNLKWDNHIDIRISKARKNFCLGARLRTLSITSTAASSYLSFSMEPSSVLQVSFRRRKWSPSKNFAFGGFLEKS